MSAAGSNQALTAISRSWQDASRAHSAVGRTVFAVAFACSLIGLAFGSALDAGWLGLGVGVLTAYVGLHLWLLLQLGHARRSASLGSHDAADG